jgi:hypothetical protein
MLLPIPTNTPTQSVTFITAYAGTLLSIPVVNPGETLVLCCTTSSNISSTGNITAGDYYGQTIQPFTIGSPDGSTAVTQAVYSKTYTQGMPASIMVFSALGSFGATTVVYGYKLVGAGLLQNYNSIGGSITGSQVYGLAWSDGIGTINYPGYKQNIVTLFFVVTGTVSTLNGLGGGYSATVNSSATTYGLSSLYQVWQYHPASLQILVRWNTTSSGNVLTTVNFAI